MTQRLSLDFVPQSPFAINRVTMIGLLLMLTAILLGSYVWVLANTAQQDYAMAEQALYAVQPERATAKALPEKTTASPVLSKAELKQANQTAALLSIEWHDLFAGLEQLNMRHIGLLSIEPNVKKQRLVITGQGKQMQAVLDYVAQVETLPMLTRVHLQKHQVEKELPSKPVSFTIVARWQ